MAPMEVPTITHGFTPSSSKASSMSTCASPRAEPPPSARATPLPRLPAPSSESRIWLCLPRQREPFEAQQPPLAQRERRRRVDRFRGCDSRQRLSRLAGENALELTAQLCLGGRRVCQDLLEAVEVQHVVVVHLD